MMLLLSKFFWRSGLVRCPEVCDDDTPADECTCSCPRTVLGERSASDVLEEHGLWQLASSANLQSMMQEYGVDDDHLLQLLCSVGHPGEMFTSAAPQDPLFWPLHGLAERCAPPPPPPRQTDRQTESSV